MLSPLNPRSYHSAIFFKNKRKKQTDHLWIWDFCFFLLTTSSVLTGSWKHLCLETPIPLLVSYSYLFSLSHINSYLESWVTFKVWPKLQSSHQDVKGHEHLIGKSSFLTYEVFMSFHILINMALLDGKWNLIDFSGNPFLGPTPAIQDPCLLSFSQSVTYNKTRLCNSLFHCP